MWDGLVWGLRALCCALALGTATCSNDSQRWPAVNAGGRGGTAPATPDSGGAPAAASPPVTSTAGISGAQGLGNGGAGTAGARMDAAAGAGRSGTAGSPPMAAGSHAGGSPASPPPPTTSLGPCTLPAAAVPAAVRELYARWKTDLLTSDGAGGFVRVRRPNSGTKLNSSNSEGTAYGMLLAVYLDDQRTFDGLWQYAQLHFGKNGLMEWEIGPDGTVIGSGAATDGDVDMAFALVMADRRWGGRGSLADSYANYAVQLIDSIWKFEVDHARGDTLMPGDQFEGANIVNISYFAPAYFRVFGEATGRAADWQRVVDSSYRVLEATLNGANRNAENGLVPAWSTPDGTPMAPPGSGHPIHHQLDSCRTPFRIAQDYCWFSEPRALAYLEKIGAFHERTGVTKLVDGYQLDGAVFPGASLHLAAFVAGAGAGAMAVPRLAAVRDEAYREIVQWGPLLGGSEYYNKSWSVLGALMLTGQFTKLPPR
jgi:endo-1,4-beta-D-glucanase Y